MIVTLTGAFRNVGDYLIGDRAISLLKKYVDDEVINLNRNNLLEKDYEIMNKARAIILCGGPAYQKNMFPGIYNLDMSKIKTKIIPLGLGWKGHLNQKTEEFDFNETSQQFIKDISAKITYSSCRDYYTVDVLKKLDVQNVIMTGCPAWYSLNSINKEFNYKDPKTIIFSDPALVDSSSYEALKLLRRKFPKSNIILTLHHGFFPRIDMRGAKFFLKHLLLVLYASFRGIQIISLAANLDRMKKVYAQCDLHIGFRVHAHIFCLSRRVPSMLLSEDSRGVGQSIALNTAVLAKSDPNFINNLGTEIDNLKARKSEYFSDTLKVMREKFKEMLRFLESIK